MKYCVTDLEGVQHPSDGPSMLWEMYRDNVVVSHHYVISVFLK